MELDTSTCHIHNTETTNLADGLLTVSEIIDVFSKLKGTGQYSTLLNQPLFFIDADNSIHPVSQLLITTDDDGYPVMTLVEERSISSVQCHISVGEDGAVTEL